MPHRLAAAGAAFIKGPLVVLQAFATPSAQLTGCTALAGCLTWLLGERGYALLWIMAASLLFDTVAGTIRAMVEGKLDGRKFYIGVGRKMIRAQLVAFGACMDWTLHIGLGLVWPDMAGAMIQHHPLTLASLVALIGYETSGGLANIRAAAWPDMPAFVDKVAMAMRTGNVREAAQIAVQSIPAAPSASPTPPNNEGPA
jgi:Bacteriophage holin family